MLPRGARRFIPMPSEASLTLDGLVSAIAQVVVAYVSRGPNDSERRDLEMDRLRLENEKLQAEIDILRTADITSEGSPQQG